MKLHLVRHGKTIANQQRLYCGHTDLPLSESGISELLDLKNQNIYPKQADIYITSGLQRTEQTLDLLYGPVERAVMPQLMEYGFGSFEMKSHNDLDGNADYQAWIDDQTGQFACPGGESKQVFSRRVSKGLVVLLAKARKVSVLAVCHGGVITYIMEELFPGKHNFYEWQPQPGRGYTLTVAPDGDVTYTKI
ncbi:MAG: histidine phosphatase family protein [Defluviitaleaceae bacterium]|nr:histidine phosphatase family protein [Defluviitaleaceae bacterium]